MLIKPVLAFFLGAGSILLWSTAAFSGDLRPRERDSTLPEPLVRVAFRSVGGHVVVPVRINGSDELDMILDTGMSAPIVMLMHRETADRLHLEGGQPVMIGGAGGSNPRQGKVYSGATVSLGGFDLGEQTIIVMQESSSQSCWTQQGVIGKSIFDRYAVEVDFESSMLSLYEPSGFDPPGFQSIPLVLQIGIPTVEALVEPEAGTRIPIKLALDLGARQTLTLNVAPERHIVPPARTLPAVVGRGIQGEIEGVVGRIHCLRLGPFIISDLLTSFTSEKAGVACTSYGMDAGGNLGIEILNRFHLILDYPHQRILLSPRPGLDKPFEYNMAGLSLEQQIDGAYLVRDLLPGSPGKKAGIGKGDRIVALNGRPTTASSYEEDRELFRRPGGKLRITIERDGERSERDLTLKRLI